MKQYDRWHKEEGLPGLALDGEGNLFVADPGNDRIQKLVFSAQP